MVEPGISPGEETPAVEAGLSALTIPPRYRRGVAQIGHLSDASFADLATALKKLPEAANAQKLSSTIASDVPSVGKANLRIIVESLAAMQSIQSTAHVDIERFSSDVWGALKEDSPDLAKGLDEEAFTKRVAQLLATPIYLAEAKIAEIRREIERRFCGARILTDVRPAFAKDATKRPAITIMHTLEITFHDDLGRHREFYVSLDDEDLATLQHAVERASVKKETLTRLLKKAEFDLYE